MWQRIAYSALVCALLTGAASFGFAGDADLEARVEALEKRLESLERKLESKDAEIARLKERFREGHRREEREEEDVAPEEQEPEAPFGDSLDRMLEELRKRGFDWDFDWGLPGRRLDPLPRPGPVPLPRGSRAFLGVELEDLAGGGVRIARVVPGTAAEEAGLAGGDVIAEIDGVALSNWREVSLLVRSKKPGDRIKITVLRDGGRLEMDATLGEGRPATFRRVFPLGPSIPGWPPGLSHRRGKRPGLSPPGETEATRRENTIDVEVETRGGEAKVSLSAPGLYLTGDLARELGLDKAARRKVEEVFAKARGDVAASVSEMIREGGGALSTDAVAEKRLEAERAAREALAGVLTRQQLARLERAQAEVASRSHISISTSSSTKGESEDERRETTPRRRRGATARGDGTEF